MDLPFVTATQLAEHFGLTRRTLLNHLIYDWPKKMGWEPCPHAALGDEVYFNIIETDLWIKDKFGSG